MKHIRILFDGMLKNYYIWLSIMLLSGLVLFWLVSDSRSNSSEHISSSKLKFLCAAGIRPPVDGTGSGKGVVECFQEVYPDIQVETSFGPANLLLGQIKLSQTGDLFFPGDSFYIEQARKEGLIYDTKPVARFIPVIMVQSGNPLGITNVSDLASRDVRLAVADKRVAALGRITPEIFHKSGVDFDELQNIEFTGITSPEIAQMVDMGHIDATIVWRPVASLYPENDIIEIPPDENVIVPLSIAVLKTSENKEAALRFAEFISGPKARMIFERYSYDVDNVDIKTDRSSYK